jgi:hypothetical protein
VAAQRVPNTTRIDGGRSAGVVAVVVAGVLGLIIWIGIAGRPPAPPPSPPAVARASAVTAASLSASPSPEGPSPSPADPSPSPPDVARSRSFFNVAATIGDRQYVAELEQISPRLLRGSLEIPVPPRATRGKLALSQAWLTRSHAAWSTFGEFDLRLDALSAGSGREYVVLDASRRPGGSNEYLTLIAARGYDIEVRAQTGDPLSTFIVEVRLTARDIVGDDGVVGCRAFGTCDSIVRQPATR